MLARKKLIVDSICLDPLCSVCNQPSARIEITEPHAYPQDALKWKWAAVRNYRKFREFDFHYLVYEGPGGGNGEIGDPINLDRKIALQKAFTPPYDVDEMRKQLYDMAGFCEECHKFYCSDHWNISATGFGTCPEGHGKSMNPHWSPEE